MIKFYAIFFFFFALNATSQTTVTISAAADNTMYENVPNNSNALGQNIFSGTNNGPSPRRGLIRFDMAAIPAGAVITSVTLTLNCNQTRVTADNISLHKVLSAWGEGTSNAGASADGGGVAATANDATWSARFFPGSLWTTPGGDYTTTASATTSVGPIGFYQWSSPALVADVQSWVITPASNFGWILICNETTFGTARKFGSRENATVANRPSLSVTYTTTLPVTLSYFKAIQKNKSVLVSWETSQEINNHYFEVLHSRDGQHFSSVGKINGQATSSEKHQYSFNHVTNVSGNHFYKLAQVDFDGRVKHSSVEKVLVTANEDAILVFPNPVMDKINVSSGKDLRYATYQILNVNGLLIETGVVGSGIINANGLAAGTYYLCLYSNNKIEGITLFIKQ